MSWIEDIGEKELTDKHIEAFITLIELAAETDESGEGSAKRQLVKYIDTATSNLERIRKAATNE